MKIAFPPFNEESSSVADDKVSLPCLPESKEYLPSDEIASLQFEEKSASVPDEKDSRPSGVVFQSFDEEQNESLPPGVGVSPPGNYELPDEDDFIRFNMEASLPVDKEDSSDTDEKESQSSDEEATPLMGRVP